jgi:hypothetical protein
MPKDGRRNGCRSSTSCSPDSAKLIVASSRIDLLLNNGMEPMRVRTGERRVVALKRSFHAVVVLAGVLAAEVGTGICTTLWSGALANALSESPASATGAPMRSGAPPRAGDLALPVPPPASKDEHYWYLTKVTGWGGSYLATNYIGVAARLYTNSGDCESTKSRWAQESRHAYAGLKGLLAEKQVEDVYNCVQDTSSVWKGLRPEKRWFLFAGTEPEAYAFKKPSSRTHCTVNLAILSSGYMSGWNFESLQGCGKNFPLWTRSHKEPQPSWKAMAGSGFWARTDKQEGAEAYEQGYSCMACVRGSAPIFRVKD